MIVADTNLVAYLLLESVYSGAAGRVWNKDPDWRLPSLWRSEFLNVLARTVLHHVCSMETAHTAFTRAVMLFGASEVPAEGRKILDLACARRITAYDAHFVAAAMQLGVPLVTGDRQLLKACRDVAMSFDSFAGKT